MLRTLLIAGSAALITPLVAQAQVTYRCTGNDGKKYYGSTIPMPCVGRPVEQLNSQGLVVRRIDPEGDEKERAEKAAALAKAKEDETLRKEETRRNRALLATYTSERDIEETRSRALTDNQKAVAEVEAKIDALKKRRAGYDKELAFYSDSGAKDKKSKGTVPSKLTEDIRNSEIDLKAQEDLLAAKRREVVAINAKYDEDKKRYLELTGQDPASRGKALGTQGVTVTTKSASPQQQRRDEYEAQQRAARDRNELQRLEAEREADRYRRR